MLAHSDYTAFLKQYWTPLRKEATRFKKHPFFYKVRKDEKAGGLQCVVALDHDDGPEGSATFGTAQAIAATSGTGSQRKQMVFNWVESFQLAQMRNTVIRETRNVPEQALMKAAEETTKAQKVLARKIARALYRTGYGEKGVIASTTTLTTKVINLTNVSDARFFKIGDRLQFAQSLSGHVLRDGGDFVSVVSVDYDAGTVTTDAPTNLQTSITGIATGDFIFASGDRQDSATPTRLLMPGLAAWIPDTAPAAADSFGGIDRSVGIVARNAGLRYPASGTAAGPILETFLRAMAVAGDYEADISDVFCAPNVYSDLLIAFEGRKRAMQDDKMAKMGFSGFTIDAGLGSPVNIIRDGDCPPSRAYALNMETWVLQSLGEVIQNDLLSNGKDDQAGRDVENNSGLEWRYVFHGHLACNEPGQNMVIKFG